MRVASARASGVKPKAKSSWESQKRFPYLIGHCPAQQPPLAGRLIYRVLVEIGLLLVKTKKKRRKSVRRKRDNMKVRSVSLKFGTLCVQETRWKGSKARNIGEGYKLFYHGVDGKRDGVGVILKEECTRNVVEV